MEGENQKEKNFKEKLKDKSLDVGGKIIEKGVGQFLEVASGIKWLIYTIIIAIILGIAGIIALAWYLLVRFT